MAEIAETDLMLVCLEAAKSVVARYSMEVNNALGRISRAMEEGGEVVISRVKDNPVERDIVERSLNATIGLVSEVEGRLMRKRGLL